TVSQRDFFFSLLFFFPMIKITFSITIIFLNGTSGWRVISSYGKPHSRSIRKIVFTLHQTFPERPSPDNRSSIVILNRSGQNFARRSGIFVNQNKEFAFFEKSV